MALLATQSHTAPVVRQWLTVTQSDGSELRIQTAGDENLYYYMTEDGVPVARMTNGDWCYATLANGHMRPAGEVIAHGPGARHADETQMIERLRKSIESVDNADSSRRLRRAVQSSARRNDLQGSKKGLIVLVEFSDTKFATPSPKETFNDIANKRGYNDNGFYGSIRDYFHDQSNGQFDFNFDVIGPVTLPQPQAYYGQDNGRVDSNIDKLVIDACAAADPLVDFNDYDWDGDKAIDMLYLLHAGYGQNYDMNATDKLWPGKVHLTSGDAFAVHDGVNITVFAYSNELYGKEGTQLAGIGTICHEFSHCFGLKDHYGTNGSGTNPMHYWDIMDYGAYNDDGRRPVGYTAYEKWFCGWIEPIELKSPATVTGMRPLTDNGNAYVIYNDAHRDEYFMIENRYRQGWDEFVPNDGVLITHIDYFDISWKYNTVNTIKDHPRYAVVYADNRGFADSAAGDTYPYFNNINGKYNNFLTDVSVPAATLFNENTDGRKFLGKPITNIDIDFEGNASFDFMGGGDEPSGISGTMASTDEAVTVYTATGVCLGTGESVQAAVARSGYKGIVIVRHSDGSATKTVIR